MATIYDFKALSNRGKEVALSDYKGQVILIVNTASKCGFTPQYDGLEELYKKYKDQGFVILGFPCDQFANQEPGSDEQIELLQLDKSGIKVAQYLTELPSREVLKQQIQKSLEAAKTHYNHFIEDV